MNNLQFATQYEYTPHLEVLPVQPARETAKKPVRLEIKRWVFLFSVITVLFVGLQICRCGVVSAYKVQALLHQLAFVESAHQNAKLQQEGLEDKIQRYRSPYGIEEIARERLEMVGKDEILVRIYPTAVASR